VKLNAQTVPKLSTDELVAALKGRTRLQRRRMNARPGRLDRQALIMRAEAVREAESAEDRLNEVLRKLEALGVQPLDAVRGLALIPFRQAKDLAWCLRPVLAARSGDVALGCGSVGDAATAEDHLLVDQIFSSSRFDILPLPAVLP
jgi:hypothetical protein